MFATITQLFLAPNTMIEATIRLKVSGCGGSLHACMTMKISNKVIYYSSQITAIIQVAGHPSSYDSYRLPTVTVKNTATSQRQ
jgi:hypothetical protein